MYNKFFYLQLKNTNKNNCESYYFKKCSNNTYIFTNVFTQISYIIFI